jgi:hypothetical protein
MRFTFLGCLFCLLSCHPGSGPRSAGLPGTYVKASETPYSKARDTLEVTPYAGGENIYVLADRTGYTTLRDGQPTGTGQKHFVETAVFNPITGQIQGLISGRLLVFSSEKKCLLAGAGVYQKIDEK